MVAKVVRIALRWWRWLIALVEPHLMSLLSLPLKPPPLVGLASLLPPSDCVALLRLSKVGSCSCSGISSRIINLASSSTRPLSASIALSRSWINIISWTISLLMTSFVHGASSKAKSAASETGEKIGLDTVGKAARELDPFLAARRVHLCRCAHRRREGRPPFPLRRLRPFPGSKAAPISGCTSNAR